MEKYFQLQLDKSTDCLHCQWRFSIEAMEGETVAVSLGGGQREGGREGEAETQLMRSC